MLKTLRLEKHLTQEQAADILGISRRSLVRYEQNEAVLPERKLRYFCELLNEYGLIDEEHGVLTMEQIKQICADVFANFNVEYCYLFGSYAKEKAKEKSDVDLLISTAEKGLRFYEIAELLRENLKKKIDLLDLAQLNNNPALVQEVLKDGIKIYG
ncbi:MAG TPA: nucleotidyltransferase [Clostridiales bacterium]|nr:nucleotidyltransferase [Clostridiales bacterium]